MRIAPPHYPAGSHSPAAPPGSRPNDLSAAAAVDPPPAGEETPETEEDHSRGAVTWEITGLAFCTFGLALAGLCTYILGGWPVLGLLVALGLIGVGVVLISTVDDEV